ncbi:MAG: hypothetical protein KME52_09890 [Desmonostoc geniculatum HA4340-LM1]|jgi:hypothetical protein|nr:hypothetical protein [Desmonostoc geniculatum HA4340-LM1]
MTSLKGQAWQQFASYINCTYDDAKKAYTVSGIRDKIKSDNSFNLECSRDFEARGNSNAFWEAVIKWCPAPRDKAGTGDTTPNKASGVEISDTRFPNGDIPAYGWSVVEPTPKLKLVQCDTDLADECYCIQNEEQLEDENDAIDRYLPECEFNGSKILHFGWTPDCGYKQEDGWFIDKYCPICTGWGKSLYAEVRLPSEMPCNYIISNFCLALRLRVVFEIVKSASLKMATFRTEDLSQQQIFGLHQQYRLAQDCVCDNILLMPRQLWHEWVTDADSLIDNYIYVVGEILEAVEFHPRYILADECCEYHEMMEGLYSEQYATIVLEKMDFYWDTELCTLRASDDYETQEDFEMLADFLKG